LAMVRIDPSQRVQKEKKNKIFEMSASTSEEDLESGQEGVKTVATRKSLLK